MGKKHLLKDCGEHLDLASDLQVEFTLYFDHLIDVTEKEMSF